MTAVQLLSDLRAAGVELIADGSRLRWKSPPGSMTGETLTRLRSFKPELLRLLAKPPARTNADSEIEQRRALYVYARRRGFPRVVLGYHRLTVEAGENHWRDFAQRQGQYALWESALMLDDVPEVRR